MNGCVNYFEILSLCTHSRFCKYNSLKLLFLFLQQFFSLVAKRNGSSYFTFCPEYKTEQTKGFGHWQDNAISYYIILPSLSCVESNRNRSATYKCILNEHYLLK